MRCRPLWFNTRNRRCAKRTEGPGSFQMSREVNDLSKSNPCRLTFLPRLSSTIALGGIKSGKNGCMGTAPETPTNAVHVRTTRSPCRVDGFSALVPRTFPNPPRDEAPSGRRAPWLRRTPCDPTGAQPPLTSPAGTRSGALSTRSRDLCRRLCTRWVMPIALKVCRSTEKRVSLVRSSMSVPR